MDFKCIISIKYLQPLSAITDATTDWISHTSIRQVKDFFLLSFIKFM